MKQGAKYNIKVNFSIYKYIHLNFCSFEEVFLLLILLKSRWREIQFDKAAQKLQSIFRHTHTHTHTHTH